MEDLNAPRRKGVDRLSLEAKTVVRNIRQLSEDISRWQFDPTPSPIARSPEYQEALPMIRDLYAGVDQWHGTGRYKYADDGSKEHTDILRGIVTQGGLLPHFDEWDKVSGPVHSLSVAPSRMYARLYAGLFQPDNEPVPNELGTRELWRYFFFSRSGFIAMSEHGQGVFDAFRGRMDSAVTDIRGKYNSWMGKLTQEIPSMRKSFLEGTDIEENYPILFGLKEGFETLPTSNFIAAFETRIAEAVTLEGLTHIEVPHAKVDEVKELLAQSGHSHIPVIPIEWGEEYCRGFSFKRLALGDPLTYEYHRDNPENVIYASTHERQQARTREAGDKRLKGGVPLWHVFLEDPDALYLKGHESQEARHAMHDLLSIAPSIADLCQGLSIDEARTVILAQHPILGPQSHNDNEAAQTEEELPKAA